jgi:arginase family enzyme
VSLHRHSKKVFGVALDVADDPWSLQLKRAWLEASSKSHNWQYFDPYDALTQNLINNRQFSLGGKFPVPSWLRPRPEPSDRALITAHNMQDFIAGGGLLKEKEKLHDFVAGSIFPQMPVMIGIDHSSTGGVISALAEKYGPEKLSIIVLDQHFDAIPLSLRIEAATQANSSQKTGINPRQFSGNDIDRYCCGNFWSYLINDGNVKPENMAFIGVADYPGDLTPRKIDRFQQSYLDFEKRGCSFYPLWQFEGQYIEALTGFLRENISTPYVYVSLDLDVGSYSCVHAARYMDRPGISRQNLLDVAGIIADGCRRGRFELVGFDVMEFNTHFLGIEMPGGLKDLTLDLVRDYIAALVAE